MNQPPWRPSSIRRPAKPDRTARTPLTQAQIVQTGLRIVKTEGIDGVSMRRIAAEFETGPSSLYAHVTNKDELLQLMFDEMCGLVAIPELEPERWKEQVLELARSGYQVMIDHNDLAKAALATIPSGPNAMRVSDAMLGMMITGGIPPRLAAWAMDRIFLYITADAYEYSIWRSAVKDAGTDKDTYIAELTEDLGAYFAQVPADIYPNVHKYAHELVGGGTDQRFEFGLQMMLDGLERHVTAPTPTGSAAAPPTSD